MVRPIPSHVPDETKQISACLRETRFSTPTYKKQLGIGRNLDFPMRFP